MKSKLPLFLGFAGLLSLALSLRAQTNNVWTGQGQPTAVMTPAASPAVAPYVPPVSSRVGIVGAQGKPPLDPTLMGGFLSSCASFLTNLFSMNASQNVSDFSDITNTLDQQNETMGNVRDQTWDDETAKYMGGAAATLAEGCSNFIDKEGRLGPWGREIQVQVREYPDSYVKNEPSDVLSLCPGYKNMPESWRERFWIWTFASLASSESGCNPQAINRKCNSSDAARTGCKYNPNSPPNGNAIGLFQLEPNKCPGKEEDGLLNAFETSRCAVRRLATELDKRSTLLDYNRETYWGPLRGNTTHRGDQRGRDSMRSKLGGFIGCHGEPLPRGTKAGTPGYPI